MHAEIKKQFMKILANNNEIILDDQRLTLGEKN